MPMWVGRRGRFVELLVEPCESHVLPRCAPETEGQGNVQDKHAGLQPDRLAGEFGGEQADVFCANPEEFESTVDVVLGHKDGDPRDPQLPPNDRACQFAVSRLNSRWVIVLVAGQVDGPFVVDKAPLVRERPVWVLLGDTPYWGGEDAH